MLTQPGSFVVHKYPKNKQTSTKNDSNKVHTLSWNFIIMSFMFHVGICWIQKCTKKTTTCRKKGRSKKLVEPKQLWGKADLASVASAELKELRKELRGLLSSTTLVKNRGPRGLFGVFWLEDDWWLRRFWCNWCLIFDLQIFDCCKNHMNYLNELNDISFLFEKK